MIRISHLLGLTFLGLTILAGSQSAHSATEKKGITSNSSPAATEMDRSNFDSNCAACHPTAAGQDGYGPGLFGVVGSGPA
jgi:cytochrome c2